MCSFTSDERGITEEFTSVPALVVVLIGFGLFFALVGGAYHAHTEKMKSIDEYRRASFILEKLTTSGGVLTEEGVLLPGGVIDGHRLLQYKRDVARMLREKAAFPTIKYDLVVTWSVRGEERVCRVPVYEIEDKDHIAASKKIPVRESTAQIVPGTFTVRIWEG